MDYESDLGDAIASLLEGEQAGDHHGGADGCEGEAHHGGPGPGEAQQEVAGQTDGGGLYEAGQHCQSEHHPGELSEDLRVEAEAGSEEDDDQGRGPGGGVPLRVHALQHGEGLPSGLDCVHLGHVNVGNIPQQDSSEEHPQEGREVEELDTAAGQVGHHEHDQEGEESPALDSDMDVLVAGESHLAQDTVADRPQSDQDDGVGHHLCWSALRRTQSSPPGS